MSDTIDGWTFYGDGTVSRGLDVWFEPYDDKDRVAVSFLGALQATDIPLTVLVEFLRRHGYTVEEEARIRDLVREAEQLVREFDKGDDIRPGFERIRTALRALHVYIKP